MFDPHVQFNPDILFKKSPKSMVSISQLGVHFETSIRIMISEKCWSMLSLRLQTFLSSSVCLSPYILRALFYGFMHETNDTVVDQLQGLIQTHWELHPPYKEDMYEVYTSFLFDELDEHMCYSWASQYTFWTVIRMLKHLKMERKCTKGSRYEIGIRKDNNLGVDPHSNLNSDDGNVNNDQSDNKFVRLHFLLDECLSKVDKLVNEIDDLSSDWKCLTAQYNDNSEEKINVNKLYRALEMYLELLELDLVNWLQKGENDDKYFNSCIKRPLLARLMWEDNTRESTNNFFTHLSNLYVSCSIKRRCTIAKCIMLVAEITRMNDRYSWYTADVNSSNIFSSIFAQHIICTGKSEYFELVKHLSPAWFQILVINYIVKGDHSMSALQAMGSGILNFVEKLLLKAEARNPLPWSTLSDDSSLTSMADALPLASTFSMENCFPDTCNLLYLKLTRLLRSLDYLTYSCKDRQVSCIANY